MLPELVAPQVTFHQIKLPLTTLHYIRCGEGPPLVIAPATISEIRNWLPLAQFMGQRFTTYFFELPGHGKSTPFPVPFSSALIGAMLEEFIDRLGYATVSIMGFSFGGILALRALHHLQYRIKNIVLISPFVSKLALQFSNLHLWGIRTMTSIFQMPVVRQNLVELIHNEPVGSQILRRMQRIGKVEETISLERRLREIPTCTFDVLAHQLNEILNADFPAPEKPFPQPCYFAMSTRDPLLNFTTTLHLLEAWS
ncbi:MAG: alpha/beta hydrolase [Anaerolineae bacterium]|nr:alpha/beta hydrolase [Anaerolineae bacterium]